MEPEAEFRMWATDNPPPSHSVPPAVAAKVAVDFGEEAFRQYHLALLHAYFAENRTISDEAVLVDVAADAGLPKEAFADRLRDLRDPLQREVEAEHESAITSGIDGTPAVVVDGRYLIPGAVPTDYYRRVIAQLQDQATAAS